MNIDIPGRQGENFCDIINDMLFVELINQWLKMMTTQHFQYQLLHDLGSGVHTEQVLGVKSRLKKSERYTLKMRTE